MFHRFLILKHNNSCKSILEDVCFFHQFYSCSNLTKNIREPNTYSINSNIYSIQHTRTESKKFHWCAGSRDSTLYECETYKVARMCKCMRMCVYSKCQIFYMYNLFSFLFLCTHCIHQSKKKTKIRHSFCRTLFYFENNLAAIWAAGVICVITF